MWFCRPAVLSGRDNKVERRACPELSRRVPPAIYNLPRSNRPATVETLVAGIPIKTKEMIMRVDLYTKIILTIIAACLVGILVKDVELIPEASAQGASLSSISDVVRVYVVNDKPLSVRIDGANGANAVVKCPDCKGSGRGTGPLGQCSRCRGTGQVLVQ